MGEDHMGPKLSNPASTVVTSCTKDADCYGATVKVGGTTVSAAATTDAAKKLICCLRVEPTVLGTTTAAKTAVTSNNTTYGYPKNTGEYAKICQTAYPTYFTSIGTSPNKYAAPVYTDANKNEYKVYCDGGAKALALGAAAATVALSMY